MTDIPPAQRTGPPEGLPPPDALLRPEEVARWLGCSVATVHRYVYHQGLPFVRMAGGRKRFRKEDVRAWIDRRAATIVPEQLPGTAVSARRVPAVATPSARPFDTGAAIRSIIAKAKRPTHQP